MAIELRQREIEIHFSKESDRFALNELASYLQHIKSIYAYLQKNPRLVGFQALPEDSNALVNLSENVEDQLVSLGFDEGYSSRYYKQDLGDNEIFISRITKQSPLVVTLVGTGVFLAAAVVISGGKVDTRILGAKVKIEINALGDGLEKLQKVFERASRFKHERKIAATRELPPVQRELLYTTDSLDQEILILERARLVDGIDKATDKALKSEIKKMKKRKNR